MATRVWNERTGPARYVAPDPEFWDSRLSDAARRLLAQPDRPTAILAHNDDMAVGAIMVAHQLGLSLPGDLSVVGFDDSAIARSASSAAIPRMLLRKSA